MCFNKRVRTPELELKLAIIEDLIHLSMLDYASFFLQKRESAVQKNGKLTEQQKMKLSSGEEDSTLEALT